MLFKFAKKYNIRTTLIIVLFSLSFSSLSAKKVVFNSSQEKDSTKLTVRSLSKSEKRQIFNCYSFAKMVRLSQQYHGLEIIVENKTNQDLVLAKEKIGLPVENNVIIKDPAKISPMLLPILTLLTATSLLAFGIGFALVPSVVLGAAIGVTALNLNTQGSSKSTVQKMRKANLDTTHPTLIPSFSKIQKIVFVKEKDTKKSFNLTLETVDGKQKISFEINA